ncbi:MAG TPA: hypothetical protein VLK33_15820 [Terriglobales bacterium]|nr:hypothetical protein [Terriglobales bacterium]
MTRGTYVAQVSDHPLYWLCDLLFNGHIDLTAWRTIWIMNYNRQYEARKIAELNASIEAFNAS